MSLGSGIAVLGMSLAFAGLVLRRNTAVTIIDLGIAIAVGIPLYYTVFSGA